LIEPKVYDQPAIQGSFVTRNILIRKDPSIEVIMSMVKQHLTYAFPMLEVVEFSMGGILLKEDSDTMEERMQSRWNGYHCQTFRYAIHLFPLIDDS
jgi:hypothetical protein